MPIEQKALKKNKKKIVCVHMCVCKHVCETDGRKEREIREG